MILNPGKRRRKHKQPVIHTVGDPDLGNLDYGLDMVCVSRYFFFLFRATVCGSFRLGVKSAASAAGLYYSHSNMGPKPHLQPIPQLMAMLEP